MYFKDILYVKIYDKQDGTLLDVIDLSPCNAPEYSFKKHRYGYDEMVRFFNYCRIRLIW